jgi:hypothetical protein
MPIVTRVKPSSHLDDVEAARLEKRGVALIHQDPTMTDSRLATLLARESGRTREDVACVVCCAFSAWYRLGAPTAPRLRVRMAS